MQDPNTRGIRSPGRVPAALSLRSRDFTPDRAMQSQAAFTPETFGTYEPALQHLSLTQQAQLYGALHMHLCSLHGMAYPVWPGQMPYLSPYAYSAPSMWHSAPGECMASGCSRYLGRASVVSTGHPLSTVRLHGRSIMTIELLNWLCRAAGSMLWGNNRGDTLSAGVVADKFPLPLPAGPMAGEAQSRWHGH